MIDFVGADDAVFDFFAVIGFEGDVGCKENLLRIIGHVMYHFQIRNAFLQIANTPVDFAEFFFAVNILEPPSKPYYIDRYFFFTSVGFRPIIAK